MLNSSNSLVAISLPIIFTNAIVLLVLINLILNICWVLSKCQSLWQVFIMQYYTTFAIISWDRPVFFPILGMKICIIKLLAEIKD